MCLLQVLLEMFQKLLQKNDVQQNRKVNLVMEQPMKDDEESKKTKVKSWSSTASFVKSDMNVKAGEIDWILSRCLL